MSAAYLITKAMTAAGLSDEITIPPGGVLGYSSSGTFTGYATLERAGASGASWERVTARTADTNLSGTLKNETPGDQRYRFRLEDTSGVAPVTGTCTVVAGGGRALAVGELLTLVVEADHATAADTNFINLRGTSFAYEPNATYQITVSALGQAAAATTGFGIALDVSHATNVTLGLSFVHQLANTGTLSGGSQIADAASAGVSSGIPAGATNVPIFGGGLLIAGAAAGHARFTWKSEAAAVSTCKAGTTFTVRRVR